MGGVDKGQTAGVVGPMEAKSREGGRQIYGKGRKGPRRTQSHIPTSLPFFKVGTVSSDVWQVVLSSGPIRIPSPSQVHGLQGEKTGHLPISREWSRDRALTPQEKGAGQPHALSTPYT